MANTIKIKRSAVSGKVPTTTQLELGELAVNTHDGKLYTKKDDGTAAVVEIGGTASTADALTTARSIALSGDVSGSTSFDGSANVTITATVADDSHNHVISNVDGLQTALDAKAPLASPTFTGTPAAPTAAAGTNTTQVATTAFVSTAVANVVDSAPGALDTLNELAAALGDDANFSTTVTNSIATKLPLAGGQMTGNITFSGSQTVDGRDLSVDGAKLDGIASGAEVNVATNLAQGTRTTTTVPVTSSTGTNATLTAATTSLAGVMTSADKSKLDGIASGATNVTNNNQLTNGAGYITSSGSITGNAATATQLATARTIGGVSFNGTANINLPGVNTAGNQNTSGNAATATQLATARTIGLGGDLSGSASFNGTSNITISATVADDSHNHVVSNIDGLQTTLNSKANLSGATFTGEVQVNARLDVGTGSGGDHEIRIYKGDNNVSDHIQFYNGTTRMGEIGCHDTTWLRINQVTAKNIYTPRYIRADGGFFVDGTTKGINGSGNFIGGTIAGASDYGTLLRSNANDTATGILTFNAACRGQVDTLTSASTITPNFNNSNNFKVTLATNTTIANPSNLTAGQSGAIAITYSGDRTVAFGSYWKFPGGTAPTMTSTSGKVDVVVYYVESSTRISAQVLLNTGG